MLMKLLILIGAITAFGVFVFRAARGAGGGSVQNKRDAGRPPQMSKVKDLVKCPRCGIFLPSDRSCDCEDVT